MKLVQYSYVDGESYLAGDPGKIEKNLAVFSVNFIIFLLLLNPQSFLPVFRLMIIFMS
ncbi:hypothetical protein NIES4103_52210 [Nostoc sp. NIES-4103]|nr:hypothetical protein NIES4103_52210 [Nostoc sp. NIES-4103]